MSLKEKRKVLGRGLSELLPDLSLEKDFTSSKDSSKGYAELPTDKITFFSYQPRITFKEDESFQELVKSIQERGIIQPIVVRKITEDLYECVAGERRLRAAKKLGLKVVPALIKELSDEAALQISILENLQRKDLNPIEIALAYKTLINQFGLTQEEVANQVGKDRATVANFLRLLKLPKEIQEDLLEERLTTGHAKALLSIPSEDLQLRIRKLILEKNLSVRETEKLIEKLKREPQEQSKPSLDPDLLALSEEISKLLGIKVEIKQKNKKPCFIFHFDNLDRAEEFLEKLKNLT